MENKIVKTFFGILLCVFAVCCTSETKESISEKENFWVFVMAGQSNMAGRGEIEALDTIINSNIWVLNDKNSWEKAKEPLHYYEPKKKGLDIGISFANKLQKLVGDSISIGLVPCAVGGSSVEQWVGDSIHKQVKLFSNYKSKVKIAQQKGTLKAILWHQGESNANEEGVKDYKENVQKLFSKMRNVGENDTLPIIMGEIGSFLSEKRFQKYPDSINHLLAEINRQDENTELVETNELPHKGDSLHFNSEALRILGKKYANAYVKLINEQQAN
ncbi:sialate O-acetylesterase [Galbibacter mesophilus]|uniref:sialate O-acetylesterase n=1 Tax=Galbibacter mesophilus TaxID=379069 RepID=UPI00191D1DDF|nr:sialate O-acetylesterase [Galbibacter mesophilus]MCM5663897.1 sialate O-acetylesterase [Galbibacter mesophilus]